MPRELFITFYYKLPSVASVSYSLLFRLLGLGSWSCSGLCHLRLGLGSLVRLALGHVRGPRSERCDTDHAAIRHTVL